MRKTKMRICGLALAAAMVLSACGHHYPAAPELIAPREGNESTRPVVVGDLGEVTVQFGTVVPMEYCHFWKTPCRIDKIEVAVGDKVEAGQVLATADAKDAEDSIESLNAKIAMLSATASLNDKKYALEKQKNDLEIAGARAAGDAKALADAEQRAAVLDENHRYDGLLTAHRIAAASETIGDKQEIIDNGTLVASHGGTVSYVKSIVESDATTNSENVVVVADTSDCYLRMDEFTIKDKIDSYDEIYAMSGDRKATLKSLDYSGQERSVAERSKKYPALRLTYDQPGLMPEAGSKVPVFFTKNVINGVLLVGNDSVFSDSKGDFVYVATETGREKRYVKLGRKDDTNSEVLDGLSEGEQVFYSSDIAYPEHYQTVELKAVDYDGKQTTNRYTVENASVRKISSRYTGVVESVYKKNGDPVAAGDLICVIRTEIGNAELTEIRTSMTGLEDQYQKNIRQLNEQIKELEEKKKQEEAVSAVLPVAPLATPANAIKATPTDTASPSDGKKDPNLTKELSLSIAILSVDKELAAAGYDYAYAELAKAYDKANTNNDGTGRFSVYSDYDGVIGQLAVAADTEITEGGAICTVKVPEGASALLSFDKKLPIGQKVTFSVAGGKKYTGTITGYTGCSEKESPVYLTTKGDVAYLTTSVDEGASKLRHCVSVEDEGIYNETGSMSVEAEDSKFSNAIIVPDKAVYTEKNPVNESRMKYFVWKLEGDHLVKQYIKKADYTVSEGGSDAFAAKQKVIVVVSGLSDGDVVAIEEE